MLYFFIQINFVFQDDFDHYSEPVTEEPVTGNEPPTDCVYETTGGIPCKAEFTYEGIKYGQWHKSCAPGTFWGDPWCYDIRGAKNWGRCTVDSNDKPTCSKALNYIMMTI